MKPHASKGKRLSPKWQKKGIGIRAVFLNTWSSAVPMYLGGLVVPRVGGRVRRGSRVRGSVVVVASVVEVMLGSGVNPVSMLLDAKNRQRVKVISI